MQEVKVGTAKSLKRVPFGNSYIPFESALERDFLIFHTFKKNVIDIFEKPISVPFSDNEVYGEYTPTYLIQFSTGGNYSSYETKPLLVDIKPVSEWSNNWRTFAIRWKPVIQYCKEQDFRFKVFDERRIRHKGLKNIKYINQFKDAPFDNLEKIYIIEKIKFMGPTTIGYILERFFKGSIYRQEGEALIFHLLANGYLEFNCWDELTEESEIWCE